MLNCNVYKLNLILIDVHVCKSVSKLHEFVKEFVEAQNEFITSEGSNEATAPMAQ